MLNTLQQQEIQAIVESMSGEERLEAKESTRSQLEALRSINYRPMLESENYQFHLLVETLMRIEALEQGKGMIFRLKRRLQLTAKYLPSVG